MKVSFDSDVDCSLEAEELEKSPQTPVKEYHISNGKKQITHTETGKINLRGEFESITAIAKVLPSLVPKPEAVGTFSSDPDVHFYLCRFVGMKSSNNNKNKCEAASSGSHDLLLPSAQSFGKTIAALHKDSLSPNGKFGFQVPTMQGALMQPNAWKSSWEKFFSDLMERLFDWEEEMHGVDEEMRWLKMKVVEKVIPRLLRPLETGGNAIDACLVHGDLWDGNTAITTGDGEGKGEAEERDLIFDASSFYAHNECEFMLAFLFPAPPFDSMSIAWKDEADIAHLC